MRLRDIFRRIRDVVNKDSLHDNISINSEVRIYLVKDGKTLQSYITKNTWTPDGCIEIAKFLQSGSAYRPSSISCDGTGGSSIQPAGISRETSIVIYDATWAASEPERSGINTFRLEGNGLTFAITAAPTQLIKPEGVEMKIYWRNTISGV